MSGVLEIGVIAIFAREFLEAAIIIGQFRTIIFKSSLDGERQKRANKIVWASAAVAFMIAFVMILITGIALGAANKNFSMVAAEIIEGVSKVVAAFAILLLSLKVPKWLGLYDATPDVEAEEHAKQGAFIAAWVGCIKMFDPNDPLEPSALKFNVGWNIWREMAEIGAFLFPYFLRDNQNPLLIPASAAVGIAVALVLGGFIYWANGRFSNKVPLAVFMATLTGWLATGLFTGGCHEFEEAVYFDCLEKSGVDCRMTPVVFEIGAKGSSGRFWRHWELPMTIFKPFGYSKYPTALMIAAFWSFFVVACGTHYWQYWQNKKAKLAQGASADEPVKSVATA
ncbi:hypothetical protein KFE25_004952 [Diacronema lutheri]|uniref:Iron permease FTR1 n=2 Tax=Diacronema lutheri TaxID=2081491 RepID=A0A8J5XD90_DIALT|nr:hypothetical protein KFE25_004952 [Diacronema lutheri]